MHSGGNVKRVVEYKVTRDIADYTSGSQRLPGTSFSCRVPMYQYGANQHHSTVDDVYVWLHLIILQLKPSSTVADVQGSLTPAQTHRQWKNSLPTDPAKIVLDP